MGKGDDQMREMNSPPGEGDAGELGVEEELAAAEDGRKEMNSPRRTGGRSESAAEDGRKEMNTQGQERG
jgi:hypothetical protein